MKLLSIAIAVLIMATPALAALSPQYEEWGSGPARHLMTKDEIDRWKTIDADTEAEAFIDLFWARRDPTPQTPRNRFQEEFEARVHVADREFTTPRSRGAMTDRGKVLILLGPPWQVGSTGAAMRSEGFVPQPPFASGVVVPSARPTPARQTWTYGYQNKPHFIKRKEITFTFVEENRDDWQLAVTERANPGPILRAAVDAFIISPHLTAAPVHVARAPEVTTSFTRPQIKVAYEAVRAREDLPDGAHLTWGEFVSPDGDGFVSFQLYVRGGAGIGAKSGLTLFGAVENAAGEIVQVLEEPAEVHSMGSDWYVDKSLSLEPGQYIVVVGLASEDGNPVAVARTKFTVAGLDAEATGVSPLLLATSIKPGVVVWGDVVPFTFGGLKVVPKGDSQFSTRGDLWYFLEMRNPGVTAEGEPDVRVQVDIEGKAAERTVRMNFPMGPAEITRLKGADNRYAVGMAIPLEGFRPGDYTMRVRVVDSVLGRKYDFERQFKVRG